jgi:hypothetical protein
MSQYDIGRLVGYLATPFILSLFIVFIWTKVRGTKLTVLKVLGVAAILIALTLVGFINSLVRG